MPATPSTKLKLAFRSGGRCALSDCRIVIDTIGEAAHIHGEKRVLQDTKLMLLIKTVMKI